jgi:uncharacterized protein YkvS
MSTYQELFDARIKELLEKYKDNPEEFNEKEFTSKIKKIMEVSLPETANILYEELYGKKDDLYKGLKVDQQEFQSRLEQRWYKGLVLFKSLITLSEEAGINSIEAFRSREENVKLDFIDNVLFKIHARAVQTSKEVYTLIYNGFPDGALARWRSLHENNVIFRVLVKNYKDLEFTHNLVQRYKDFSEIERSKEISLYNIAKPKLNLNPLDNKIEREYALRKREILDKYGVNFDKPNMWAKPLFHKQKSRILFYELEQLAEIDKLNPYYNQANYQVHTSPKGLYQSNGFMPDHDQYNFFNYGESNYGLSLPGSLATISLTQITTSLLILNSNIDNLIIAQVMQKFTEESRTVFSDIQKQMEKEKE